MKNDSPIALPADPNDPEDFDVSVAGLERGLRARELRRKLAAALDAPVWAIENGNLV